MRMRPSYTGFAASVILAAAVGIVRATPSPSDCDSDRITFTCQADVDSANCTTVKGDVVISANATGNITLNASLQKIGGNLLVQSCTGTGTGTDGSCSKVLGVSSMNLTTVQGSLEISDIPSMQTITLPRLQTVGGALQLSDLPSLRWLNISGIRRVGSFHLVGTRNLRQAAIGQNVANANPRCGLKNITDMSNRVVEVRHVGLEDLDGLVDFWDARLFLLEDLPNLQKQNVRVGNVSEMRVSGNGNLTLWFWETGASGSHGPYIDKLNITGVKHISPCFKPNVREFVAVNNPVKYLHFNFEDLQRFEVRDNPNLKTMVPWPRLNRFWTDVLIRDNPNLALSQYPVRSPDDNLTAYECPDLYNSVKDQWNWFPNNFNSVVVGADIDNTFFDDTFTSPYLNASEESVTKPRVLKRFEVNSTNATFSCNDLNTLRSQKGAFPGHYSCQGNTVPAGGAPHGLEARMATVFGTAIIVAMLVY